MAKRALARLKNRSTATPEKDDTGFSMSDKEPETEQPVEPGQEEKLKKAHAINFLKQNLEFQGLRKELAAYARNALKKSLEDIQPSQFGSLEQNKLRMDASKEIANKILQNLEKALREYLPMPEEKFVELKESLRYEVNELCLSEAKKLTHKKLKISLNPKNER